MRIDFWGGPKDGEVIYQTIRPQSVLFFAEDVRIKLNLDMEQFEEELLNYPDRSMSYHKYVLQYVKRQNKAKYVYSGLI